jgi:hypothetical protein
VYVRDLVAGKTIRASVATSGALGTSPSYGASISGDGRYVAFTSYGGSTLASGASGWINVFVRDTTAGTTKVVSSGTR